VNIEADFGELCEEHELRDKLTSLEVLCEEQGIADGDAAEGARWAAGVAAWRGLLTVTYSTRFQAKVTTTREPASVA
jgi:hypothetical protein